MQRVVARLLMLLIVVAAAPHTAAAGTNPTPPWFGPFSRTLAAGQRLLGFRCLTAEEERGFDKLAGETLHYIGRFFPVGAANGPGPQLVGQQVAAADAYKQVVAMQDKVDAKPRCTGQQWLDRQYPRGARPTIDKENAVTLPHPPTTDPRPTPVVPAPR